MKTSEKLRIKVAEAQGWIGPWRFGNVHLHGTSPRGLADKDVPNCIDGVVKDLCLKIDTLSNGIKSIRGLINESKGVSGLHLNGDVALWSDLEEGGSLEEWLLEFDIAEDVIKAKEFNR